ncbi:MAG: ATPase, partial [Muribaculaceae bacterium]|nr:ATPase [Muribaculaceae bacterium]
EKEIIRQNIAGVMDEISAVVSKSEINELQKIVEKIYIDEKIENYIVDIVFATREPAKYGLNDLEDLIEYGASPRASISLAKASKAYAFLQGRGYVIPEDVRAVCHDVMRHRIGLTYEAEANNISADEVITDILDKVKVP